MTVLDMFSVIRKESKRYFADCQWKASPALTGTLFREEGLIGKASVCQFFNFHLNKCGGNIV